jgi:hypothetical protein
VGAVGTNPETAVGGRVGGDISDKATLPTAESAPITAELVVREVVAETVRVMTEFAICELFSDLEFKAADPVVEES